MAHLEREAPLLLQGNHHGGPMGEERSLCVICAWRKDCQKKFLKSQDISFRCPEYVKDISIKDDEKPDDQKEHSDDHKGRV
jgi:hypothetical protein